MVNDGLFISPSVLVLLGLSEWLIVLSRLAIASGKMAVLVCGNIACVFVNNCSKFLTQLTWQGCCSSASVMWWPLARTSKVNRVHLPARASVLPDTFTKRLGSIASIIEQVTTALAIALILAFLAALSYIFVIVGS